jgi:hypothetical protein
MPSKACVSEAQLELPRYVVISYNINLILVNTADSTTTADVAFGDCMTHAEINTSYVRSGLRLSVSAWDLDVLDDGSLQGAADLKVLAGEKAMCSESITLALTPALLDGGAL